MNGLVLSGGALRGLSHIGVLKAIEKLDIKIHAITGCSMGAIIGYLYASGKTAKEIEQFVMKYKFYSLFDFSISKLGIKKTTKLKNALYDFTGIKKFKDLKIPLYINATNISTEKEIVFKSGDIFNAIRASIAFPGLFAPIKKRKQFIIDGGVLNQVPFDIFPKKPDNLIIVKLRFFDKLDSKINIARLIEASIGLMQEQIFRLKLNSLKTNHIIIEPNVSNYALIINKKLFKKIILKGELSALKKLKNFKIHQSS